MLKYLLPVLLVLSGVVVFVFLFEGVAAAIDNFLGIRTRADIRLVKRQMAGSVSIGEVVGADARWTAKHRDELWRTFVECRVQRNGDEQVYLWEVDRGFSPRENYSAADGVFVTPLTRATGRLTPSLVPPVVLRELPELSGMSAAALYQAARIGPKPSLPIPSGSIVDER